MNESFGDGGPAFPGYSMNADEETVTVEKLNPGMSLRDWFAGRVLPVLISDDLKPDAELATVGYRLADAMLAERSVIHAEFEVTPDSAVAKAAADCAKWSKEARTFIREASIAIELGDHFGNRAAALLAAHPGVE